MGVFRKRSEDVNDVESSEKTGAGNRIIRGGEKVWHAIIGYNDTEANRIGVPYVSSKDWLSDIFSEPGRKAVDYFDALFPFTKWILSYNSQWLIGDLIAGITVGLVVVPQSLSYATVAMLRPEFGLYSSFVGVVIYVLFATSKDVTIGPVAVMSLQTANVIRGVEGRVGTLYSPEVIASALAFICGVVTLGIGLLRLGWIVEFIPAPAVSGFMTGSAFTIAVGQVPKLMGISGVTTNGPASYKIVIDTLKNLPTTKIDAAFGLGTLTFLYFVRWACNYVPKRRPRYARTCFFISVFRSAFIIIILTAAVYGWLKPIRDANPSNPKFPISIIKTVPPGFQHMGQPYITGQLLSDMAGEIPVSVIVLLLEHIAISKSFGRLNNYKINPNQELVAIGVTNLVGPTFGAYAATGSFSRSAIKAKSGVRTPLAGWITAIVVLVALYGVTGAFYWIPNAVLSAVIIHAVGDLMAPPSLLYRFWLVSPFEFFIWLAAVLITIFTSVEIGVYVSVAASAALLLVRIARPRGRWLGRVRIHYGTSTSQSAEDIGHRDVYVPLDDKDGMRDPSVRVDPPPPGVLIYRFEEAFTYPNASYLADTIVDRVKTETQPNRTARYKRAGDRPWNDPGPINPYVVKAVRVLSCGLLGRTLQEKHDAGMKEAVGDVQDTRPHLKAIIFDCSSVSNVDTTSVQALADIRQAIERFVGDQVEFHFVSITSPWIRRALLAAGFGTGRASSHVTEVAPVVSQHDRIHQSLSIEQQRVLRRRMRGGEDDIEAGEADLHAVAANGKNGGGTLPTVGEELDSEQSSSMAKADESSENTSESGLHDKPKRTIAFEDDEADPTAGAGASSNVSVPVIWNHDLTPFFHLDISTALAAATGKESFD